MTDLNCTKVVFEPPDLDAPAVLDELVRALAGISLKEFLRNELPGCTIFMRRKQNERSK